MVMVSSEALCAQCPHNTRIINVNHSEDFILGALPKEDFAEVRRLFDAAQEGDVATVADCLNKGISPDVQDWEHYDFTPAHHAVHESRPGVFDLLIQRGADLSLKISARNSLFAGLTVWNLALKVNEREIIGQVPDAHIDEHTFFIAAEQGNYALMTRCLKKGIDINVQNKYYTGYTALHYAVERRRPGVAEWLLNHDANPNIADFSGRKPKEWAQEWEYEEIINLLVRNS